MKKIGYKYKIEKVLLETNWNICIIDSNDECWDDEH